MKMKLRNRWLKTFLISTTVIIAFIAIRTIYKSSTFKPQSIFEVPFRERAQSKFDDDVRVTAAVLSAEESRQIFGVGLAQNGIQPVWVRVENHDNRPYWLMYSGLDPNYFSPIEAAQTNHSIFSGSLNTISATATCTTTCWPRRARTPRLSGRRSKVCIQLGFPSR